jgi:prolyl 4-hydroxylase
MANMQLQAGLNERWRLAKYWPGDQFERHVDGIFQRTPEHASMFTVNIYLNSSTKPGEAPRPRTEPAPFAGGNTRFYTGADARVPTLDIRARAGMALVFRQPPARDLLHDGAPVTAGNKYLLRTDVMYVRRDV